MAENVPIILVPQSISPSDTAEDVEEHGNVGLGLNGGQQDWMNRPEYDPSSLSPIRATFSSRTGSGPSSASALSPTSPNSLYSPITPLSGNSDGAFHNLGRSEDARNPFNFTTQQYTAGGPAATSRSNDVGKRRGHKFKHSSISANIFLEPPPRAPLQLPAALPMPTKREAWRSMTHHQTLRLLWCACHFLVAAYVQLAAHGSLAMTALSRLLFFDAAGAVICVAVDVMGNFEVWKRSSIKHPFGLERADVLAGFGMAVFISFMGLDVLSHGIQHSLESAGSHVPHSAHTHTRVSPGSVDLAALLAITSTLVSAVLLKNHARIGKAMRFELIAGWGRVLGNPSHFLTLSCSTLLLLLPLLSIEIYKWFDTGLSFTIALLMLAFGARLGTSLASMLLMSLPGRSANDVKSVIVDIEADPSVSGIEEASLWQVHYGLCMANFKVRYRNRGATGGYANEMARLRERVESLVKNRLGGGYGSGGGVRWEVSLQMGLEKD
ncbi:cation diffusion zinc membrane transporter Zrg17 [Elasticomyces elasticus]|nr:cation diffusion zinc membrane transporter Zrg17 [Elasticomyces elasticus]